eukprot:scaffold8102_cov73-Cyclotella_meneghiniana.AAC.26
MPPLPTTCLNYYRGSHLKKNATQEPFPLQGKSQLDNTGEDDRAGMVSVALAAVTTTIALAIDQHPLNVQGSKDFLPVIAQTLSGRRRKDPRIQKKMSVEA